MTNKESYQVVKSVCAIGNSMLQSGAEIYRVEQTIQSICRAYGIDSIQCSVTPAVITASYSFEKLPMTHMLRLSGQQLNLHKVELLNDISRSVSKAPIPLDELKEMFARIQKTKSWKTSITALSAGIGTGAFAVIFGGNFLDFIRGFLMGFLLRLLMVALAHYGFQDIFLAF